MPTDYIPLPPGIAWTKKDFEDLGKFVMQSMNPYKPHTAPRDAWEKEVQRDNKSTIWSFRDTPLRVESALKIPYDVWYPRVKYPDRMNKADWDDHRSEECILLGYVGGGAY